ncbi:MAG TPA: hypothetical protein VII75_05230 [Thermoanaerobaculia bacterium]
MLPVDGSVLCLAPSMLRADGSPMAFAPLMVPQGTIRAAIRTVRRATGSFQMLFGTIVGVF